MKPIVTKLTIEQARAIVPHLGTVDRAEIQRAYVDLEAWARSRVELGTGWALVHEDEVIAVGGVITNSTQEGVLWLAGREGWARRHIRHALRVFDVIKGFGGYSVLRCRVVAQNGVARRFAERLGFDEMGTNNGFVHYGMAT